MLLKSNVVFHFMVYGGNSIYLFLSYCGGSHELIGGDALNY